MLDTDKLIEMYKDDYSIPYLSNYFGIDRRKVTAILKRSKTRLRKTKTSRGKSWSRRTKKDREERISGIPIKSENRGNRPNGESVNSKQEWIFISVNNGINSSQSLYLQHDCPYSGKASLGNAIRKLKDKGMLDYPETRSGSQIKNIIITEWGKKRIHKQTLQEKIIQVNRFYPNLDYVDIAEVVGCNRSYPHKVLSNLQKEKDRSE